jgi:hypothetical protein
MKPAMCSLMVHIPQEHQDHPDFPQRELVVVIIVLKGHKKVNQCIVASTCFANCLEKSDIKEDMQIKPEEERHAASKMLEPTDIIFAGRNDCPSLECGLSECLSVDSLRLQVFKC